MRPGTESPHSSIDLAAMKGFLRRLLAVRSHSTEEGEAAGLFREELETLGFDVSVDELGNVVGELRLGEGPTVLLDMHLDTVPVGEPGDWTRDPSGEVADGRVYGRGSVDMKGPIAACVHGVASLGNLGTGTVVISGTVAEELAEGCAVVPVARAVRPDYAVICEPSGRRIARGQRGRAEVVVEVEGRPCHSAFPETGLNAAEVMADVITALRELKPPRHETLGKGVLVLTDVKSLPYPGLSVVPERCRATFDRRTLVGETEEDVLAPIRAVTDEVATRWGAVGRVGLAGGGFETYTGARLETRKFAAAWLMEADAPIVRSAVAGLRRAGMDATVIHYRFCTNGSGTAGELGIPTIGYGPGDENEAHTADESIRLDDLGLGAYGYASIVSSLLAA